MNEIEKAFKEVEMMIAERVIKYVAENSGIANAGFTEDDLRTMVGLPAKKKVD